MKLFADEEDEIYGEIREVRVNKPDGSQVELLVTDKWLRHQKLKELMKSAPNEWVTVNFIGPHGKRLEILKIDEDIDASTVNEFIDPKTKELYGLYAFREGEEFTHLVKISLWETAQQKMEDMAPFIENEINRIIHGDDSSEKE